jgi:F-type H+-transporting ATPase subunit b
MEQTLAALAGILQKAVPTVILLVFLHLYLKAMLFKPLEKVLKDRDQLTTGARKSAEQSLAAADRKTAEYEATLRDTRNEVYREQEETRRRWLEDQSVQLASARERAQQKVAEARRQITQEATAARENLAGSSATLADQIASSVLSRGAK